MKLIRYASIFSSLERRGEAKRERAAIHAGIVGKDKHRFFCIGSCKGQSRSKVQRIECFDMNGE